MTTSFAKGTSVEAVDSRTYSAYFEPDWCIGTVPHGGYVTSIFVCVAKRHFDTVHASYDQPHTIAVQLTFLRRSSHGPATFTVTESKLGRRTSTLHIALTQGDDSPPLIVGYFTQSNIHTEVGVSLQFPYNLSPAPRSLTSTKALREGTEPNWSLHKNPFNNFRKAGQHLLNYLPRAGQAGQGLVDQWLTMARGERFTQETLGYVVDSFPQLVETAETSGDLRKEMERLQMRGSNEIARLEAAGRSGNETAEQSLARSQWAQFWYPTVLLNMEVKKALPPEGVEWLFSRVRAKKIHNGRMDIELVILDEGGEIVALSNHVALIVPAERNMARSIKVDKKDADVSKL